MPKTRNLAERLSTVAISFGFIGIPLWLLSYVWIPFRLMGRESYSVWNIAVACEIGAMSAGLFSIVAGVIARKYAERNSADYRRAIRCVMLGAAVFFCIVFFNLAGIIFFSLLP